jgi:phosphatidylserine decarboxylase
MQMNLLGFLLYLLPRNALSRLVGWLVNQKLPQPLRQHSIKTFAQIYKINLQEAELELSEYESIGHFFTRKLKASARPLVESPLVHPADSVISQASEIHDGKCIQAKGKTYSVSDLVSSTEALKIFKDGLFITYYLCPTDYHRVHSPVDGEIISVTHIPGTLWPVNQWSVNNIDQLFCINERVVVNIKSRLGQIVVVFVGATNVGKISLAFDPTIISNQGHSHIRNKNYDTPLAIQRGQELGTFHMGSTVVLLLPSTIKNQRGNWDSFLGQAVKVNTTLM